MKVVFLGTPEFALASLDAVYRSKHEIVAVVSQPDRAKDRKGNLLFTPVKQYALDKGLPFYAFESIRRDGANILKSLAPDIMVTAAYGQILSKEILQIAPHGVINVHASLLPKYRGSAPIQWAVINGEKETGVTIMQTDVGVDNGAILAAEKTHIGESETAGELSDRLKEIGARLLIKTMDGIESGSVKPIPQDESKASKCRMLTKEDGHIDFGKTKAEIVRLCNGVTPSPGAYALTDEGSLKIGAVRAADGDFGECGEVTVRSGRMIVACSDGGVELLKLQLPGKKMMDAGEFLRGHKFDEGMILR